MSEENNAVAATGGTSLQVRNRVQSMTGAEKSAVILMALGENMAPVWDRLGEDEIREISR